MVPESGDWRQRLYTALIDLGLPFTADALENSRVVEVSGELQITTTRANKLAMRDEELRKAVAQCSPKPMRLKVIVGRTSRKVKEAALAVDKRPIHI